MPATASSQAVASRQRGARAVRRPRRFGLAVGLLEQEARVGDVVEPAGRVLDQAAAQDARDCGRQPRRQGLPLRLVLDHGGQDLRDRLAPERPPRGQHLVKHDAESPDVGALVHGPAPRLLGRHVGGGAEDEARLGPGVREGRGLREIRRRPGGRVAGECLGEPEIEDLDLALRRHLHVGGLEVAVDDALLVGFPERLGDLPRIGEGLVDGNRPALQPLGEVLAGNELHRQEVGGRAVGQRRALEAVDVGDVGVVERGEQFRFALEARQALGILRQLSRQHLDRHLAAELRVGGAVHLAHAAGAERCRDLVRTQAAARREAQCPDHGRAPVWSTIGEDSASPKVRIVRNRCPSAAAA